MTRELGKSGVNRSVRTRFAPTPSGYLHIGNAYSMMLTWLIARKSNGTILLRIDDIDSQRVRQAYVDDIFESLAWLGLDYDEGPTGTDDFFKHYSWKLRSENYEKALGQLRDKHALFACNCSRSAIKKKSPEGKYLGTCLVKELDFEESGNAWRFDTTSYSELSLREWKKADIHVKLHHEMPFFVVRKKDGSPSYQLASLADDVFYKVNLVVRGSDLLPSTAAQHAMATVLDWQGFSHGTVFLHHPLISDLQGKKISKSEGAESLKTMREKGVSAKHIWNCFSKLILSDTTKIDNPIDLLDAWREGRSEIQAITWNPDRFSFQ